MASWGVKCAELSTAEKLNKTAQYSEYVHTPQFAIYHVVGCFNFNFMITMLSIIVAIIFVALVYWLGNYVLDTFYEDFVIQLVSTIYGVILLIGFGLVGLLAFVIYFVIRELLLNTL